MFFYLLLLFTLLPFIELSLLLEIGSRIGTPATLGLIILTGVVGASLARWQGLRTAWRIREQLAAGEMPTDSLLDGMLILLAGAVLITPGVLTDAAGFALLIPPIRQFVKRGLRRRFANRVRVETSRFTSAGYEFHQDAEQQHAGDERVVDARVIQSRVVEDK